MARKFVDLGETVRLYSRYNNLDTGDLIDPIALSCTVKKPDGTLAADITYPSADFVRQGLGQFFVRVSADMVGTHTYKIVAQISLLDFDVRDGKFDVEDTL